jgi:hypothetical protein
MYDAHAQAAEWEAKQTAREDAARKLASEHPHLVTAIGRGANTLVAAAKNIRKELALAFPRIKFSVKSDRFSGGDSIDVYWTDGPTSKQVDAIIGKYAAGSFDGMTDSYDYSHSVWTDAFGDAKYVHTQRHYSDALITDILAQVAERLGGLDRTPTLEDYKQGRLWQVKQSGGCNYDREVNIALSEASRA